MAGKVMPHSIEAEQSVLCTMFLTKAALNNCLDLLTDEEFYIDAHAKIFGVVHDINENGEIVDATTVTAELSRRDILDSVGGVEYLAEIIGLLPTAANYTAYTKIVKEKAVLRRLIDIATGIVTEGYEEGDELNAILNSAESKILNIAKERQGTEFKKIQTVLFSTQALLEKLAAADGKINGISTGFERFDKLTTGFHPGELIILAARPSVGKTAFALNLATNMAMHAEKPVAFFNLEMPAEQLAMRMISTVGGVPGEKLKSGELETEWDKINEAILKLADAKMYIDDTVGMTVGEIRGKCRRLAASESGLGIVFVDHLGLINPSSKYGGNRQQEVAEISRSLKMMAMELGVPVIALSQLSRNIETRDDKYPMLSDLRESGAIEQDADIVAFLHREDYYAGDKTKKKKWQKDADKEAYYDAVPEKPSENENSDVSELKLIIAKHRNGALENIKFRFTKSLCLFVDID